MNKIKSHSSSVCESCGKRTRVAYNRPNSLHRTKRKIYANIQIVNGKYLCTRCIKTIFKKTQKTTK
jgi:ribosomal protein L28